MKRSRFVKRPLPKRAAERGGDEEYLVFVRTLPCAFCSWYPPSHAHHETGGGRGKGQKAPDRRTLPFCHKCHRDFHDCHGVFEGYTAEMKRAWQDVAIQNTQWAFDIANPQFSLQKLLQAD